MKKLFEIPIYALSPLKLNDRVSKHVSKLKSQLSHLDEETFLHIKDIETFPMRSWDYNHIVGYIQILMSNTDIVFKIFLPIPIPTRYDWRTKRKTRVRNICANGTHFYLGTSKNNDEIREAIKEMLNHVIKDHVPDRFYVDREAFDTTNSHLDYISIKQIRE